MKVSHENSGEIVRRLAAEEGILVGISSGAAMWGDFTHSRYHRLGRTGSLMHFEGYEK